MRNSKHDSHLKKFKTDKKFNYQQLKKYCNQHGISASITTLMYWTNKNRPPRLKNIKKLSLMLNIKEGILYEDYSEAGSVEKASEIAPLDLERQAGS
jgi:TnpA family transposase